MYYYKFNLKYHLHNAKYIKCLGKGGYGEVIKARHKTLNVLRAIKIIKKVD